MKMRVIQYLAGAMVAMFALSAQANATTILIDFQDGVNQGSSTNLGNSALQTYFETALGRTNVSVGDANWYGSSNTFGSDAIFTSGYSSTLDFDTSSSSTSNYALLSIQFDWGVYDATSGRDFGLDLYDDACSCWHNNYFSIGGVGNGATGNTGLLTFDATWQITGLRMHDSGSIDVGMDNLTITDNVRPVRPQGNNVPGPSALSLMGFGLVGVGLLARRRKRPLR